MKYFVFGISFFISLAVTAKVVMVDHELYLSVMDCDTRLPVAVLYALDNDKGNAKRHSKYIDDEKLKQAYPECHPDTEHDYSTYQSVLRSLDVSESYDVGHLAMSNHLDDTKETSRLANQFSNLAPQASAFNRNGGAWYESELVTECHRDVEPLTIVVGAIDKPDTTSQNYFVKTFKQTTPDYFYRIIYWTESRVYRAWLFENKPDSNRTRFWKGDFDVSAVYLDSQLPVEVALIKSIVEYDIPWASDSFVKTDIEGSKLSCRETSTNLG